MAISKQEWDRFMNQARVKLPGATDAGIKGELFDVFSEFFGTSNSWIETISVPVVANTSAYQLDPAEDGQIIRLLGVFDENLRPVPATMPKFGELRLALNYDSAHTFTAVVAKNVTLPTAKDAVPIVPDWVMQVYSTVILDGILGRMMGQIAKSYSNPTIGTYHLKKFNSGVNSARVATMRANSLGTQAWSYPQQFRTRGQKGGVSVGDATRF